ncbi:MAG TPA: hypothetical protein VNU26_10370, partial [Mycobacteriales bacterium]|nr:hypothetical protein [Mycobacteriales bacterium]
MAGAPSGQPVAAATTALRTRRPFANHEKGVAVDDLRPGIERSRDVGDDERRRVAQVAVLRAYPAAA